MPEPDSKADEAVRDARDVLWEAIGRYTVRDTVVGELLDAFEAAIRASERAKVEALVEAAQEAATALKWSSHSSPKQKEIGNRLIAAIDAVRAGRAS